MTDRPIIFSGAMVRALLAGRKTQTRRIIKVPGIMGGRYPILPPEEAIELEDGEFRRGIFHYASTGALSGPYRLPAAVGDRLYVREAFWIATRYSYGSTPGGCEIDAPRLAIRSRDPVHFSADGNPPNCANRHYGAEGLRGGKSCAAPDPYATWRQYPSIHMPRWASRLTLIVEAVKVERLQDISEADAQAEGIVGPASFAGPDYAYGVETPCGSNVQYFAATARDAFAGLWSTLHTAPGERWEDNPFVVALTFSVVRGNIDQIGRGE